MTLEKEKFKSKVQQNLKITELTNKGKFGEKIYESNKQVDRVVNILLEENNQLIDLKHMT